MVINLLTKQNPIVSKKDCQTCLNQRSNTNFVEEI